MKVTQMFILIRLETLPAGLLNHVSTGTASGYEGDTSNNERFPVTFTSMALTTTLQGRSCYQTYFAGEDCCVQDIEWLAQG